MKKEVVFLPTAACLLLLGIVINFVFGQAEVAGQTTAIAAKPSDTKVIASVKPSAEVKNTYSAAAVQNARLRDSLAWVFGGRTHRGWNIYAPLISYTIGTDSTPDSTEFAVALAKWQQSNHIGSTGVLDKATMEAFVGYWQTRRLRRSSAPAAGSLLSAPVVEFFDPTRSPDLLQLERDTYAAYKRMLAAAARELKGQIRFTENGELAPGEKFLRIVSAYRSPEYQAALRRKEPNAGRAALALHSPHSTGQALDLYVGGEPVSTKDPNRLIQVQTPAYRWLVKNAERFGFYPYFYEPWHWEYVPNRQGIPVAAN